MLPTKYMFILATVAITGLAIAAERAPPTPTATDQAQQSEPIFSYDVVDFAEPKDGLIWTRPGNVRFALLQGCGGGAGGEVTNNGGAGGGAGPVITTIVGPLKQDVYRISIGRPGAPGSNTWNDSRIAATDGGDTRFEGKDISVVFPHGVVNSVASGNAGKRSLFAEGGNGSGSSATPRVFGGVSTGSIRSGGGEAGMGKGGAANPGNYGGGENGGVCAGGGGAAQIGREHGSSGGAGGPGFLRVVPIVNIPDMLEQTRQAEHSRK